jgi:hypothetical protein
MGSAHQKSTQQPTPGGAADENDFGWVGRFSRPQVNHDPRLVGENAPKSPASQELFLKERS